MAKLILCLRHLGHENFWKLVHDTGQLPADKSLVGKKVVVLTLGDQPESRACVQAVQDLGGEAVLVAIAAEDYNDPARMVQLIAETGADLCMSYGLPCAVLETLSEAALPPILGARCEGADLPAVLGDLALLRSLHPDMDTMRISWIGGATPLAHSLIEASMYVPYELFMALPEWGEPDRSLLGLALTAGGKIFLTREVHLAADEGHFVYAGAGPKASASRELQAGMLVDEAVMAFARPQARLLLGEASPSACRIKDTLLHSDISLQKEQETYRLRALKVLVSWLV